MPKEQSWCVRLDHPSFAGILTLKRVPKYLRFVLSGLSSCSKSWDALDQLTDEPQPNEMVFAAILKTTWTVHIDRRVNGRKVAEWLPSAQYELIENQPPDDVMRSTESWQRWCGDQEQSLQENIAAWDDK